MRLRYTRRASRNLDRIFSYIAQDNPAAAARVVARIEQLAEALLYAPGSGIATDRPPIRRVPVVGSPYLIFYEVRGEELIIHHIRHGARRPWARPR